MRILCLLSFLLLASCGPDDAASGRDGGGTPDAPAPGESAGAASPSSPGGETERPTVLFMGTSLTAGLGLRDPDDRWPERLAALADSAGHPIEVVNAGVSGETSAGGLRRLEWVLSHPLDVLVLELGANDGLRGLDPAELESNLRTIVRATRERYPDARVVVVGMEAPTNLGTGYTRRFREVFPRVARSEGAAWVPFLLDGVAGVADLNQPDGIHPTAEGHRRMARNAWPVLDSVLGTLEVRGIR